MSRAFWAKLFQKIWSEPEPVEPALCWFCCTWRTDIVRGMSIGEMVYSSVVNISQELADNTPTVTGITSERVQEHHIAAARSGCAICYDCIRDCAAKAVDVDDDYVQQHLLRREQQYDEMADTDTHMIPWSAKEFPFGCWLYGFPDIDVRRKFWSRNLAQLYMAGFRLAGEVWFGEWEAGRLLEKFATDRQSGELPSGFEEHVASKIHVEEPTFYFRVASLRAVVYDVSMKLAATECRLK